MTFFYHCLLMGHTGTSHLCRLSRTILMCTCTSSQSGSVQVFWPLHMEWFCVSVLAPLSVSGQPGSHFWSSGFSSSRCFSPGPLQKSLHDSPQACVRHTAWKGPPSLRLALFGAKYTQEKERIMCSVSQHKGCNSFGVSDGPLTGVI